MTVQDILEHIEHRPWVLPKRNWKYYQEWNNAIFLHWKVDGEVLRRFVPVELELDTIDGSAWVSLVAFTMEKIRPRVLPPFSPISNFDEINIRTYVKANSKTGVYFLSIEGGKRGSCQVARALSKLPYRFSRMSRIENQYSSRNNEQGDEFEIRYLIGSKITAKSESDQWLTERYALFQDLPDTIAEFEIHHEEWEINELEITGLKVDYPRFSNLINNSPDLKHYSKGVKVIAWDKTEKKKTDFLKT